jgi:DNA-binding transcriptional ArsR family regulator
MVTRQQVSAGAETGAEGAAFELMANSRRRHVLSYLRERTGSVSVDDLASQVIARELLEGGPVDPESVEATLRHVHLPKLDAAGLLEYDEEGERVDTTRLDPTDERRSGASRFEETSA